MLELRWFFMDVNEQDQRFGLPILQYRDVAHKGTNELIEWKDVPVVWEKDDKTCP